VYYVRGFTSRKIVLDLSIIILNWNNREVIFDCLDSVFREIENLDAEVIVVDNGSTDGSLELIKKNYPKVVLIENKENLLFAKGNNQGFELAKGRWIMTLGSDTIVQKDAIQNLLARAKADELSLRPRCKSGEAISSTIFAPQLISKSGSVLLSCRKIPTFWNMAKYMVYSFIVRHFNSKNKFWGEYRMVDWNHDTERFVEQPEATCWLGQKSFFESIGGLFDEEFPLYFNDVETAIRVRNADGKFLFCPEAKIIHLGGQSTKRWSNRRLWLFREGLLRLMRKHYRKNFCDIIMYGIISVVTRIWVWIKNVSKSQNTTYEIK